MENIINFKSLPTNIQLGIVRTLFFYKDCHIEHAHGKMEVCVSYCLKSKYAEDEWISQEFAKEDFGIRFSGNDAWFKAWNSLEQENHKKWADIDDEAKAKCSADFDKMIEAKAKEELARIIEEAR